MSNFDYIVIGVYLVFMLSLGPIYKSFSKTASDFFRGGGGMLWWVVGSSAFMNSFSAWSFTGGAAKAYETGTFLLILFSCNTVATLVCLAFTAHRFRQLRVITAVEAIRDRFGNSSEQIFNWLPLIFNILFGGIMLYTISVFMSGVFGAKMYQIILILGAVMIAMTLLGGSWAATAGDFVQMLVVLTITVIMAVLALNHEAIGGIGGLIANVPKGHFEWTEFERPSITWIYAITLVVNQIVFANSMQSGGARYLFVKDGGEARKSAWVSVVGFILLPIIWLIPAFASSVIFPDLASMFPNLNNPNEAAYVAIAKELLPTGLLGLLVCGIFAASLTSMNSLLNVFSAGFVRNFWIRVVDKNASEGRQILVGRIFIFIYGLIWMGIAMVLSQNDKIKLFELILIASASIGLPAALPMLYGMFVKKVPAWAGWSTMVFGFIVSLAIYLGFKYWGWSDALRYGWDASAPLSDIEFGDLKLGLTTGTIFLACTIWFFFTGIFHKYSSPEYREQVDKFFEVMNTPIDRSTEHEPDYESDSRQYAVLANLCLAYGGMVLLLLLVPNDLKARMLILICGGAVVVVGVVLRLIGIKRARNKA
ncbi:Osmoregulated proline transporter OpuE [Pontiella desulfatans]|uniref:Osmoregulated proline transporter OpuE n=1 Tax=Pontiella desulfatans TaxID=2750659 RepID=A0A6C2UB13_PONDE|nr:transporter [Pontiella desulfatans]VGO16544.1 Osmoregulated proline transporter OpuE [Pontiella desulfatans]